MFTSLDIIKSLDQIRMNKKMSILTLTEGIMSRKKYTRLTNHETQISFYELTEFLKKLSIPFQEFSLFVVNQIENQYPEESTFYTTVLFENYEHAYQMYYPKLKKVEFKTLLGEHAVPAFIELMKFKLEKQSQKESLFNLKEKYPLQRLLRNKIITDSLIGILFVYVHLCDQEERLMIGHFVYDAIFDPSFKFFVAYNEISRSVLHLTGMYAFDTEAPNHTEIYDKFQKIIKHTLIFQTKARLSAIDHLIFKMLYNYQNKHGLMNKDVVYYYIASYFSAFDEATVPNKLKMSQKDFNIFKELLKDNGLRNEWMYGRMLNHGNIW